MSKSYEQCKHGGVKAWCPVCKELAIYNKKRKIMTKSREHVTTNGRAAFYASLWPDLRQAALDCGWALGLHGSLANDMDIMAMPWTEEAIPAFEMILKLKKCFSDTKIDVSETPMPNNRTVYTLSIWADFYLDINIIQRQPSPTNKVSEIMQKDIDAMYDDIVDGVIKVSELEEWMRDECETSDIGTVINMRKLEQFINSTPQP